MWSWRRKISLLPLLGVLIVVFPLILRAAINRGNIEGIVTDPQGAVMPDVAVTITNVDTNVTSTTQTNSSGYYTALELVPGKYVARFESIGFQALDIREIEVLAGVTRKVDAQLVLGAVTETVEVTSQAPLLETSASNFSTSLETRMVQDLPLVGRNVQNVVYLLPGVNQVFGPPGSTFGFNSQFGVMPDPLNVSGSVISVNGGQAGSNAWYLDGNLNVSQFSENVVVSPSPDSVNEFQAVNNSFAAEYSRTGGAVFNVTLKSGSNEFHGNIYEYLRNDATNARNPFTSIDAQGNIIKDRQLRYNNFGGTLGGPIIKDKTHFFFSWDVTRLHLLGEDIYTVPTPQMINGDFSEVPDIVNFGLFDPFTTQGPDASGLFSRAQFLDGSGNPATSLPPGMIDPTAQFYLNSFPAPNFNNNPNTGCPRGIGTNNLLCDNFKGGVGNSQNNHNVSLKVDHVWSEKSRFFGEFLYNPWKYRFYQVPWTGASYPGRQAGWQSTLPFDINNLIIALGNTYTLSSTMINEFRVSFSRQYITTFPTQPFPPEIMDQPGVEAQLAPIQIPTQPEYPIPTWTIGHVGGNIRFGVETWVNMNQAAEAYTFLDNLTKVMGKHTLKSGFMYRLEHTAYQSDWPTHLSFRDGLTSDPLTGQGGLGLAQFMLGAVDQGSNTGINWDPYTRVRSWGFYLQDDFRITPKFTLNLGIRYDIFGMMAPRYGPVTNFCLECISSDTGLPGAMTFLPGGTDISAPNWGSVGPRINFSYRPTDKMVFRGGYNIFYSNSVMAVNAPGQGALNSPAWTVFMNWENSGVPGCGDLSNMCPAWSLGDTTTNKALLTTPPNDGSGFPAQRMDPMLAQTIQLFRTPSLAGVGDPMVQQWNLQIERELPGNMMVSLGYVGTHGTHLMGELFRQFNFVHTADKLRHRTAIDAEVPIQSIFPGQTGTRLEQAWGRTALPRGRLLGDYPFHQTVQSNTGWDGTSIYHSFQAKVQKRFSHGLNLMAVYTFAKQITNGAHSQPLSVLVEPVHWSKPGLVGGRAGATGWGNGFGGTFRDLDNRAWERAVAAEDIPQIFNIALTYELPFGDGKPYLSGKGKIVNAILGGWRMTPNFNAQSGIPLPISAPGNGLGGRPNLIGDPSFSGSRSKADRINQWINPAAFEAPFGSNAGLIAQLSTGLVDPSDPNSAALDFDTVNEWWQFGNMGPRLGSLRSPGFWNVDTGLAKQIRLDEVRYFEFRWEMYNALNHQNLGLPNTSWCLPAGPNGETDLVRQAGCSFGLITSIQTDPRAHQFALKFYF